MQEEYENIKEILINNEIYKKVKDYSKNRSDLETYYKVGGYLAEAGKHYGEGIIKEYSIRLTKELGKGYNTTNLKRFRQFYWIIQKGAPMGHQLTWSHYRAILPLKDINEINYYINISIKLKLTKRELENKIKSQEYERLPKETKNKLKSKENTTIKDLVPNPIIIDSKKNKENITEKALHQLILEDIEKFMKQLGTGYTYVGSEYKIKIGDRYNYIDLLLFNIDFNSYVVVELKITELKKEHIGQIEVYMNYIDNNLKKITQDKTIGIIICKKDNKYIIGYVSNPNIISREFVLNKN